MACFNPRPREGATLSTGDASRRRKSFNPRPREGATLIIPGPCRVLAVSIHAPVKGRPEMGMELNERQIVSIHAPVKGRLTT